jgi:hypothetical protein
MGVVVAADIGDFESMRLGGGEFTKIRQTKAQTAMTLRC